MRVLTRKTTVTMTPQMHAYLRLAWKCLQDSGNRIAADRVFEFLDETAATESDQRAEVDLAAIVAGADPLYLELGGKGAIVISDLISEEEYGAEHRVIVGHRGNGRSLYSKISAEQLQALKEWSETAPRGSNGSVNLANWPGWADVARSGYSLGPHSVKA